MNKKLLLSIALCTALTTGAFAQDNQATREARKEKTRADVKRVGDKVETGVADGAHAVGTAGRATGHAVGNAAKATGKAVGGAAKATGKAVKNATKATGRAISGEAKKVDNN